MLSVCDIIPLSHYSAVTTKIISKFCNGRVRSSNSADQHPYPDLTSQERPELPARKLYEEVFPQTVARLTDPPIPYHRGSPYGGKGWDTADRTVGDVHVWDIWGGKEFPYQQYDKHGGRFIR